LYKIRKIGHIDQHKKDFSGFVPYVLNNVNKVYQAGKNFKARSFSKAFYNIRVQT